MAVFNVTAADDAFSGIAVDTSVLDDFNRANENPLSGGGRWTLSGTFDVAFQIFSNGAIPTSGSKTSQNSYSAAGDLTDCEVWATISSVPAGGNYVGVIARQDPAVVTGKNYYECIYINGLGVLVDWIDSGGATHTLATYAQTLGAGDAIGLRVKGSTLTAYYKPSGGSWTALGSVTDTNLTHGYIGITGFPVVGGGKLDDFGGGVAPLSDRIARPILLVDTGLTISDSIRGPVGLTDTGLAVTDSLRRGARLSATDTGLTPSDSLTQTVARPRAIRNDIGMTSSDSIHVNNPRRTISDVGLAISDSLGQGVLSTIGLTVTDALASNRTRPITATGVAVADSLAKVTRKTVTDVGLSLTSTLVARKNGANVSVNLTDVGLAISDSLAVRTSVTSLALTDRGVNLTDGILVQVNGAPPGSCTSDFRRFLLDLNASPEYTAWCSAEPGDCSTWTTYTAAILGGGSPSPPAMSTTFGDALVDVGVLALDGIIPCRAKPPPSTAPHAAFTFAVGGLTVTFTNHSTPGASGLFDSWLWTFGDGDTDTTNWNPTHDYAGAGTYLVTLTVVGADSDGISSVRHLVTVFVPAVGNGAHIDAVAL